MSTPGILVADVAWPEVDARLERGVTAVLPVGAACKEYGRHLHNKALLPAAPSAGK